MAGLPGELSSLAATFNDMLDRLEDAFARLSSLSADLAHELRTPINNLRGEIEVALGKPRAAAEYQDTLASVLEESSRLSQMIDGLMFLAQAENPQTQIARTRVDVRRELRGVCEFYEPAAAEAGVSLDVVDDAEAVPAAFDRTLVQRALGNLILNAVTHTPSGGRVRLSVTRAHRAVRIEVADTGGGIAAEHLNRVSGRFYRVDASRSSSTASAASSSSFNDRTELVDRTIATVRRNLIEGAVLVVVVLILLLGHWRGALLVATIIPLSMLFAATLMRVFNVSGNLMSLGALDFGLIVDGAVVMVENAVRRRAEVQRDHPDEAPTETILAGCLEVGRPVVFAVAIITIVYLPLLTLTGIEGKMFRPMALTVVFALLGSLILSLTFIPAALTFVLRGKVAEAESPVIRLAKRWYRPALGYVRARRVVAVVAAVTLLVVSVAVFRLLGAEFIPRLDEGALAMDARLLPSASLTESIRVYSAAERALRQFPEVTNIVSKIGRAEVATDPVGVDAADVFIALKPRDQWTSATTREELIEKMSEALERGAPEGAFSFSQPIEMRMSELISGVRSDIAIKLFGDDLEILRHTAQRIAQVVGRIQGAEDVKVEQVAGLPQLQITPNREAIARYGANIEDVNDLVEAISAGKDAGLIYRGEQRFGLTVKFDETAGRSEEAIRNLVLDTPGGARVPLSQLAAIELVEGPAQISREDARRRIAIEMNVRGRDIGSFVADAQQALAAQVTLPPGYYVTWGGQFENLERASARLLIVVPVALFLIFILLFSAFGSVRDALIVYTGVPFAVVGGVLALAARGLPFSVSAGVGFIARFGVAVLNGVVMVSYINELRQRGRSLDDAVTIGAETRLRPVLMTALVASLGFLPMALATSAGAEVQRPLATVVIGGLITSTILTLLLLPTLYQWFEREPTSP